MDNFYLGMVGSLVGIISLVAIGVYKKYSSTTNAESFVPEEGIRIIEVIDDHGHKLQNKELQNYLEHHLLDSDPEFEKKEFEKPIYVRFKHLNDIYQVCLNGISATRDDHKPIQTSPKYLSAVVKHEDKEHDVTEKLKEFHGHTKNFFDHIPDVNNDLCNLLRDHEGQLHTFDMMGNSKIHIISSNPSE